MAAAAGTPPIPSIPLHSPSRLLPISSLNPPPPFAEEAIILRRLRARETTLKRVTRRMILLSKSSSPDQWYHDRLSLDSLDSLEQTISIICTSISIVYSEREYAAFVKELASFEFGLGQLRLANDTVDAQKQETALQQSLLGIARYLSIYRDLS